jgi:PAS domain-containing protein
LPISPRHDALDAIAHAINVLVGELSLAGARAKQAQEEKEAELRAAVARAEVRNGAILRAIPDLMFVMLRDGTYVDYHARDPQALFVPPSTFLGKNVRDVLPPPLAELIMDALEQPARPTTRSWSSTNCRWRNREASRHASSRLGRPPPQHRSRRHRVEAGVGT